MTERETNEWTNLQYSEVQIERQTEKQTNQNKSITVGKKDRQKEYKKMQEINTYDIKRKIKWTHKTSDENSY